MNHPEPNSSQPPISIGGDRNECPACGLALPSQTPPEFCPRCLLGAGLPQSDPESPRSDRLGTYQLGRFLGKGGMGEVYEADEQETGRRVALKILRHKLDSPDARRRFLNEGRLAASLNHPNSVYVYGVDEIAGIPVISMELMPGGTLADKVRAQGPLPVEEAVGIMLQILDGLSATHEAGILHRDLKPSNCFIDADGTVKIGDYGLSISTKGDERAIPDEENFMGTPAYSPPEQIRGGDLTVRSDIYSLGATLFYLLAGRIPHEAPHTFLLVSKVLETPPPDLRELRRGIPKGLADAVNRCLSKRPEDRYASCAELKKAIARYSAQGKAPAQPWQRFAAGCLDTAILGIPLVAASRLISANWEGSEALILHAALLAFAVSASIAWFTLFDWKREGTPGKALLGLKVYPSRPPANPWSAGLRILGRSSFVVLLPIIAAFTVFPPIRLVETGKSPVTLNLLGRSIKASKTNSHYELDAGLPTLAVWTGACLVLFAGANRRNRWTAFQDWLTDTRVLSPAPPETSRAAPGSIRALPVDGEPMLGPFHLFQAMPGGGDWWIGFDPRLLRKVWLRILPEGAPPVAANLRRLARPGRLRWLGGLRSSKKNWDAYEFPGGRPLLSFAETRLSWSMLGPLMADLAAELMASTSDGTRSAEPRLDQVWITADGRAKLLDFPAPGLVIQPPPIGRNFWWELTERLLERRPQPIPVREFLAKLPGLREAEEIARELEYLAAVPHTVSRGRRLGLLAAGSAGPALFGLALFFLRDLSFNAALGWTIGALIFFAGLPSIVIAAVAGDGLILRAMGAAVVDRHGERASAALASRRSLIAWLPTLGSPLLWAVLSLFLGPFAAGVATLSTLVLLGVLSALLPERSLQDRLAGTWLVSR